MAKWVYSKTVKDHFLNPRNAMQGKPKRSSYDGTATIGSPVCGDLMQVWITVDRKREIIAQMRWKTFGCASAIATTSILSDMVKNKQIDFARKITVNDIVRKLGGLPSNKIHCSVLGDKALRMAINDYYRQSGRIEKIEHETGKLLDRKTMISDEDIKDAIRQGAKTVSEIKKRLNIQFVSKAVLAYSKRLLKEAL